MVAAQLYDMMIMAFKHQIINSTCPSYLFSATLNHLRGMRDLVVSVDSEGETVGQLQAAERLVAREYGALSQGEWLLIRQTLLAFVQTQRSKVRCPRTRAKGAPYKPLSFRSRV